MNCTNENVSADDHLDKVGGKMGVEKGVDGVVMDELRVVMGELRVVMDELRVVMDELRVVMSDEENESGLMNEEGVVMGVGEKGETKGGELYLEGDAERDKACEIESVKQQSQLDDDIREESKWFWCHLE